METLLNSNYNPFMENYVMIYFFKKSTTEVEVCIRAPKSSTIQLRAQLS